MVYLWLYRDDLAVVFVGLFSLSLLCSAQVPKSTAYGSLDWSKVIARHQLDKNFTGSVLVIGDRTGNLLVQSQDGLNFTDGMLIASATKWLTSTVFANFANRGLIWWTDKASKHLSWWSTNTSDPRSNITMLDLLSFTSGFVGEMSRNPKNSTMTDCIMGRTDFEECAKTIHDYCFVYGQPGAVFDYGSTHLTIVAVILMKIANQTTWDDTARAVINANFNLPQSHFWGRNAAGGAYFSAQSYELVLREIYLKNPLYYNSLSDVDYTPSSSVRILFSPTRTAGFDWHYAAGHWKECYADKTCDNLDIYCSAGAFGFYPWIDRKNDYYGILARYGDSGTGKTSASLGLELQPLILDVLRQARGGPSPSVSTSTSLTPSTTATSTVTQFPSPPVAPQSPSPSSNLNPNPDPNPNPNPTPGPNGLASTSWAASVIFSCLLVALLV